MGVMEVREKEEGNEVGNLKAGSMMGWQLMCRKTDRTEGRKR